MRVKEPTSNQIAKSITRFRWLSIGLAALIAIIAGAMFFRVTTVLDNSSGNKINKSGYQRLLSQKIRTDAIEIRDAIELEQWDDIDELMMSLNSNTLEFVDSHQNLFLKRSITDTFIFDSGTNKDALESIQLPYQRMVDASTELQKLTLNVTRRAPYIDETTQTRIKATVAELAEAQELFLPRMDSVVGVFVQASRSSVERSVSQSKFGMIILLLVLVSIILFIVEPTILIIRRQLRDLEIATNLAARADAVRWRLLTNMGHEFRTPMNAIMGFTSLLDDESLSPTEHSRLTKSIYESSTQLTHLIESMLDMTAIESGQLSTSNDLCDPAQLLAKLRADTTSSALSKNLEIKLNIDQSCPKQITTDPKRLEQIVYNLVENAIKFTQAGYVEIGVKLLADQEPPLLAFSVKDTGIGINDQDKEHIFDAFKQAEDSLTRNFGGAGLGLAISRDIAKILGGDVTVESSPGEGSTFTLTVNPGEMVKQDEQTSVSTQTKTTTDLSNSKILIVDDAKDNRVLLKHMLKRTGAKTEFAHDGQQAVDIVEQSIKQKMPFDLILMDMQMPILDGYHATIELRKMGVTTPIMAVTAHALDGDREHCINAGCNEYMSKPVNKTKLIATCAKLITGSDSFAQSGSDQTPHSHAA
jgi:signal transduction histidine kinase/CheY-like chemotaxis protein